MLKKQSKEKWPPGPRKIAFGWCVAINGSLALTFPFARGNKTAARDAFVSAMQEVGCVDTWKSLYRAGWRVVPVTIQQTTSKHKM